MPDVSDREQMGLEELTLTDPDVIEAVTEKQTKETALETSREEHREADKIMQGVLGALNLSPGEYRAGRYLVTVSNVAAHQRFKIKLAKPEAPPQQLRPEPEPEAPKRGRGRPRSNGHAPPAELPTYAALLHELEEKGYSPEMAERLAQDDVAAGLCQAPEQRPPASEDEARDQAEARERLAHQSAE